MKRNILLIGLVAALSAGCASANKYGVNYGNRGLSAAGPLNLKASVPAPSLSMGNDDLGVQVGHNTSVDVGPLHVGQTLPTVKVGLSANEGNKWLDLRMRNGAMGLTLPLVSLDIPCPKLRLEASSKKE